MKPAIQEILQYVIDHPEVTTRAAVDSYFDQFLWSLEKDEYQRLTDQEKQQFAGQLDLQIGQHKVHRLRTTLFRSLPKFNVATRGNPPLCPQVTPPLTPPKSTDAR